MGNVCASEKGLKVHGNINTKKAPESQPSSRWEHSPDVGQGATSGPSGQTQEQEIDLILADIQKHNLKRMKEEIRTDVHLFVLNNLLMSVQFFDNFERSVETAKQFKREKESEITNILAESPQDGQIMGDRKCHLLHGMGHVLAKNYIYRPQDNFIEDDLYASLHNRLNPRNTFMCEAILPLEFSMSWENLEVHEDSQYKSLAQAPYDSASASIIRFCMEEPDEENKVPKGYVRLRCVDLPISMRPPVALMHVPDAEHGYLYDYSEMANQYNDKVSEAPSDSDAVPDSADSDEIDSIPPGWMEQLHSRVTQPQNNNNDPKPSTSMNRYKSLQAKGQSDSLLSQRRPSGILPINYPTRGLLMKAHNDIQINIDTSNQIEEDAESEYQPEALDENQNIKMSYLQPKNTTERLPKSLHKLPTLSLNRQGKLRDPNSSGYETGSQTSIASRSSSIATLASEEVRDRWRNVEVKQLYDYPVKNRRKNANKDYKPEALSSGCFMNVKYQIESDDEGNDSETESDDDSDEDENKSVESTLTETRTYLNSSHFSADYCSEFHYIATRHGIPPGVVSQAVVLGTTIRCAVQCKSDHHHQPDKDGDDGSEEFFMLTTFSPCLQSKKWPTNARFKFTMRMTNKNNDDDDDEPAIQWPSIADVNAIDDVGCNVIPLGYRSIHFFNAQQCLEWQVNFLKAETLLLNTFHHTHWRTYTFAALLFRAFIAPLGPQGLGLEHIRNVMYFMCHHDFVGWNDEQPGTQIKDFLRRLCDTLGRGKMASFFIADHDLLKNIPPQNARLIQAHLSRVRDNLLVYFIFAFRNLTCLREKEKFYPMPKFDRLYKMLTVHGHIELLHVVNENLAATQGESDDETVKKEVRKKNKKKNKKIELDLIANQDKYEEEFRTQFVNKPNQVDKTQERYRRKRRKYEEKERKSKEAKKQEHIASSVIPELEKRRSIDLEVMPMVPEKFGQFRLVLVIEFFIKHFIQMAKQSNEFRAYAQATMYVLQVENLCEILRDPAIDLSRSTVSIDDIDDFEADAKQLRLVIGNEKRKYITSRYANMDQQKEVAGEVFGKTSVSHDNWDMKPSLPIPPESDNEHLDAELSDSQPAKTFEAPQLAKSLRSLSSASKKATRKESIKFMDKPTIIRNRNPLSRSTSHEPSVILYVAEHSDQDTYL